MKKMGEGRSISRRDLLKIGVAGAAAFGLMGVDNLFGAESVGTLAYRTLGRTGLKVTTLSFGAMLTPESEVIRAGLDMGINYVDTARRYLHGRSEEIVSRAIKGIRNKVYVATKTQPTSNTKEAIMRDVETSLRNLETDYIDVIQLHSLVSSQRAFIPEVREAYVKLREQGKVRFFGVTTHTNQADVIDAVVNDPEKFFDTVLVAYNFKTETSVKEAIARAKAAGLGVVAMKVQTGRYRTDAPGSAATHQAALKWVLDDTNVTTAIAGMKTLEHIRELMPVMGMKFKSADERILERYGKAIDPYYCRLCGQCEDTCPNGVGISTVNRALMYAEGYREYALAKATFDEVPNVSLCSTCSECVARCVNGLNIAEKMHQARSLFG
jgi:predicted aldo/keto reductase-like oxidoreductase